MTIIRSQFITARSLLRRSPTLVEAGRLVAFMASEEANTLTGAIINSSSGLVLH